MDKANLTLEQEVFVDMVRNAMMTGFLHLLEKQGTLTDYIRSHPGCSAAEAMTAVLGDEPRQWIKHRPFEVTEIMEALGMLRDA